MEEPIQGLTGRLKATAGAATPLLTVCRPERGSWGRSAPLRAGASPEGPQRSGGRRSR